MQFNNFWYIVVVIIQEAKRKSKNSRHYFILTESQANKSLLLQKSSFHSLKVSMNDTWIVPSNEGLIYTETDPQALCGDDNSVKDFM